MIKLRVSAGTSKSSNNICVIFMICFWISCWFCDKNWIFFRCNSKFIIKCMMADFFILSQLVIIPCSIGYFRFKTPLYARNSFCIIPVRASSRYIISSKPGLYRYRTITKYNRFNFTVTIVHFLIQILVQSYLSFTCKKFKET